MNRIEKTGRTVDDAVQAALKELGVSREDVLIEVLEEGKDALFGLIKRDAKVRVTVKEAEKAAAPDSFEEQLETVPETPEGPAPKEEPEVTEAPVSSDAEEERKAAAQDAKTFLETLFKAMGMDLIIEKFINRKDGEIELKLHRYDLTSRADAYEIRQIMTQDPSTSRTLMWQSQDEDNRALAEIRKKGEKASQVVPATSSVFTDNGVTRHLHTRSRPRLCFWEGHTAFHLS